MELESDVGIPMRRNGDLSRWADQGVLLLNRVLTTKSGESMGHARIGWNVITGEVARILGTHEVIAIMWGKTAQELSEYFPKDLVIASAHPSPLSAYRGFFGSKPFSTCNDILRQSNKPKIQW